MLIRSLQTGIKTRYKHQAAWRLAVVAILVGIFGVAAPVAHAINFDAQINALRGQIRQNQDAANQKRAEANTLANKVAGLNSEIAAVQGSLNLTRTEIQKTEREIADTTARLDKQKENLRENIKALYKDRDITPIEVLASSENLSDFVGKQQYMDDLKTKIESTIASINELKTQLEARQSALAQKAEQEKAVIAEVARLRNEQQALLTQTRNEESVYQQQVAADSARVEDLRRQQAAIIAASQRSVNYGGTGSYPWAGVPFPNNMPDPWGMYKRQCVSYTAWKVASTGRNMPYWGGRGNAKQWPSSAIADGIPVSYGSGAKAGDVMITTSGQYGHAMYVERVNGDGTVFVSQYNANWDGRYSTATVPIAGAYFIHF